MSISSGRTQTSSMSIINSSPLREGILSQEQDFDSTIPRRFSHQIDPIPECELDVISNTLPTPPQSTANCRSPSPNSVNNLVPTINTNKLSGKHSSNPTTPISIKPDDFVFISEHVTWMGALLAPYATVTASVNIDGATAVQSLTTTAELHDPSIIIPACL